MQLRPDGTVQAAAGGAVTSSNAFSNPLLNILTDGAYKNRPAAASTAYTQIPLVLGEWLQPVDLRGQLTYLKTGLRECYPTDSKRIAFDFK